MGFPLFQTSALYLSLSLSLSLSLFLGLLSFLKSIRLSLKKHQSLMILMQVFLQQITKDAWCYKWRIYF